MGPRGSCPSTTEKPCPSRPCTSSPVPCTTWRWPRWGPRAACSSTGPTSCTAGRTSAPQGAPGSRSLSTSRLAASHGAGRWCGPNKPRTGGPSSSRAAPCVSGTCSGSPGPATRTGTTRPSPTRPPAIRASTWSRTGAACGRWPEEGRHVRILSLLPSATEIVYALGLEDDLVGVTHECDWPPQARGKRAVSFSSLPPAAAPSEVDRLVSASIEGGEPIYRLDNDAVRELRPDLVL